MKDFLFLDFLEENFFYRTEVIDVLRRKKKLLEGESEIIPLPQIKTLSLKNFTF